MGKKELPSDEKLKDMCMRVHSFTSDMCEEEGYPWFVSFLVIAALADANETFMKMHAILGEEVMSKIAAGIMALDAKEMLDEADEVLRKGE